MWCTRGITPALWSTHGEDLDRARSVLVENQKQSTNRDDTRLVRRIDTRPSHSVVKRLVSAEMGRHCQAIFSAGYPVDGCPRSVDGVKICVVLGSVFGLCP